ncbi:N-acetylglucosamine-6-phosphate deacetylase [Chthonomonas calidirosea]|uniref:N-acetylglucosamine-6-phosphate deacetylase n=1 Tax=Chthonomonas calidirosea TaxID=454171 RepID=UPI0006EC497E|nr:N-acetylglucosamine-6-phosphate deacetylase [Chthonomonas calidirosea]CEK13931.1 N-acetylglucosamine 6-phosphate deacetylase [Chthonomonas calidirosea]
MRILAGVAADALSFRENALVSLEEGRIRSVETWNNATTAQMGDLDVRRWRLVPGFVDIHVHGGAGRSVMEADEEAIQKISYHLAQHGVTSFLPTTITGPRDRLASVLEVVTHLMRSGDYEGAQILGCHLEGPYINPQKRGAQPEAYILEPDGGDFLRWAGPYLETVRIMTLAPELPGAEQMMSILATAGVIVSIGHTNATYAEVDRAIGFGARHVTHCGNAMRGMESREPGVLGAALARSELVAELIWDNIHVHPAVCKAIIEAKGAHGVILISDGIPGAGMPDGYTFSLGDLPVVVASGAARLPDGTLAGSLLTLDRAFSNAGDYDLRKRTCMSSYNALCALGLNHRKGRIAPGYDADLVVLDEEGTVRLTIVGGRIVYDKREN